MKKTRKRILGSLGLVLVVVMTAVAMFLPGPEVSAVDMSSATDVILVRVVGDIPDIQITNIESGSIFITPEQSFGFDYENVSDVTVEIEYTDKDDVTTTYALDAFDANYYPGSKTYNLNLLDDNYGYGRYLIRATGDGYNIESVAEDLVEFQFVPVYGEAGKDKSDGLIYLNLSYDTENEDIATIEINIYDEDGNLVDEISPITVQAPDTRVELPFSENKLATGDYDIEIIAHNEASDELYLPYYTEVHYEAEPEPEPEPPVPVPDTGMMLLGINVSKADSLITSMTVLILAAIFGIVFVARGRKKEN